MINRGNYRSDVFGTDRAKEAFERTLFAACEKSGWLLHAYVIMSNHFHLAVETPSGNLVSAQSKWSGCPFPPGVGKGGRGLGLGETLAAEV